MKKGGPIIDNAWSCGIQVQNYKHFISSFFILSLPVTTETLIFFLSKSKSGLTFCLLTLLIIVKMTRCTLGSVVVKLLENDIALLVNIALYS